MYVSGSIFLGVPNISDRLQWRTKVLRKLMYCNELSVFYNCTFKKRCYTFRSGLLFSPPAPIQYNVDVR